MRMSRILNVKEFEEEQLALMNYLNTRVLTHRDIKILLQDQLDFLDGKYAEELFKIMQRKEGEK